MKFAGYLVSEEGIEAAPDKLKAIANSAKPSDTKGLCSFMGLVNQMGGFSKEISLTAGHL